MTFKLAAVSTVRTLTNDLTLWPRAGSTGGSRRLYYSVYAAVFYQKPCFLMNETMAWPWECAALRLWRYFRTVNDGLAVGHPPPSGSPPHSGTVRGRSEGACGSASRRLRPVLICPVTVSACSIPLCLYSRPRSPRRLNVGLYLPSVSV